MLLSLSSNSSYIKKKISKPTPLMTYVNCLRSTDPRHWVPGTIKMNIPFNSHNNLAILWMQKLRLKEVKSLVQNHKASGWSPDPMLPYIPHLIIKMPQGCKSVTILWHWICSFFSVSVTYVICCEENEVIFPQGWVWLSLQALLGTTYDPRVPELVELRP